METDNTEAERHPSFTMGLLCQAVRNDRRAMLLYRAEIRKTSFYKAHFNLALLLIDRGRLEEAAEQFRFAADRATSNEDVADALYSLASAYAKLGRNDEAVALYRTAARRNLRSGSALVAGAMHLFEMRKYALGRRWLARAYNRRRTDPKVVKGVAYALVEYKTDLKRAVRLIGQWLASQPADAEAHSDLALAYAELQQPVLARKAAKSALRYAGNNADIRDRVAAVLGRRTNPR